MTTNNALVGFERELLFPNGHNVWHAQEAARELGFERAVTLEYFDYMLEMVSDPFRTPEEGVNQLSGWVGALEQRGLEFGRFATFASADRPMDQARVTHWDPYYQWINHTGCPNRGIADAWVMQYVGIHVSFSDDRVVGDALVHATNWMRCLAWLFILVSANSPFKDGRPTGLLSRRSHTYPNRYDVPMWASESDLRTWMAGEEHSGRVFRGKARCWMQVAPRFQGNDWRKPLDRVELRSIDSGMGLPWEVMCDCAHLGRRILEHSLHARRLPIRDIELLEKNDKAAAAHGRDAHIFFEGKHRSALELARHWCHGLPALEDVLENGTYAERALKERHPIPHGH